MSSDLCKLLFDNNILISNLLNGKLNIVTGSVVMFRVNEAAKKGIKLISKDGSVFYDYNIDIYENEFYLTTKVVDMLGEEKEIHFGYNDFNYAENINVNIYDIIKKIQASLPPDHYRVLYMFYGIGFDKAYSIKEISAILNMPCKNVYSIINNQINCIINAFINSVDEKLIL